MDESGHANDTYGPADRLAESLIGSTPVMIKIRALIAYLAKSDSHILITGETGTGKDLVAQLVHRYSSRLYGPFVSLNCAALPESLLESELFGHERGAFTGADSLSIGKLECANNGTIFFDEIGEMSPRAQAKLLRALESHEIYRLGGRRTVRIDIRILAATNRDVHSMARTGDFRPDLLYRIGVGRIHLPPLRERRADIPALAEALVHQLALRSRRQPPRISSAAMEALKEYSWPGNIRELRNILEITLLSNQSNVLDLSDLADNLKQARFSAAPIGGDEHSKIIAALEGNRWSKTRAAHALGWSRAKFYRKLRMHNID